jgi:hypothetical protein
LAKLEERLMSFSSSIDSPARAAETRDQVRGILSLLNQTEHRCLDLRAQGYTTVEAAGVMGVPAERLRVLLCRIRKRFRHCDVPAEFL